MSAVDEIAAYLAHLKTSGNRIDQIIFDELPNGEGMTATDELRRLLDERGVDYDTIGERVMWGTTGHGRGILGTDVKYDAIEFKKGMRLTISDCTPEQAVEATLGRGTCRMVPTRDKPRSKVPTLTCSECGWWTEEIGKTWNYCPNCGRKVVGA